MGLILQKLTVPTFLAKKGAMKLYFERRTPTGSVFFALFGSGFARNFEKIVCMKVKEPSKTNLVTSRHIKTEEASLPVISLTTVFWMSGNARVA